MKKVITLFILLIAISGNIIAQNNIVNFGSLWKFLDDGSDQGTAWRNISYDDNSWNSGDGKFGYGTGDAATWISYGGDPDTKHATTYFRKIISVSNPGAYSSFTANIKRDDGVIVYLNGSEVYRNNMPSENVTFSTLASDVAADNGETAQSFTINPSAFVEGPNVIAVEVHQSKQNTPDMAFDLQLIGNATSAPVDNIAPYVISINRKSPTTNETNATSVIYRVIFSEKVTGVDANDFMISVTSGVLSASVSAVASASQDGTTYDVTLSPIQGNGTLRLDLKPSGTGIADEAGNAILSGYTTGQTYTIATATYVSGFSSITKLSPVQVHTNLGDQPQSKVWFHDGNWWTVLPETETGTHIWRLDGTAWTKVFTISPADYTKADCKVNGNVVHILLYRGNNLTSHFVSVQYDQNLKEYKLWSDRTTRISIPLDPGVKTASIDLDQSGRLWLVSNGDNNIYARWSDHPYSTWSTPVTIASGITDDDIGAVIAMPSLNKIGVLWSNQNTKRFGFKTHTDGADPTTWSATEIPASQSAIESGSGMADDHINMAIASDGTLYAAIKTGYETGKTRIGLLVRRPTGNWDNLYEVSQTGNRPIVILNEAMSKLKVVYAAPNAGGINYRESSTNSISFGPELTLITESSDYATSSKNNYTKDIVIFASTSKQAYSVLATDTQSPGNVTKAKDEKALDKNLIIYPNPSGNKAVINFTLPESAAYTIVLYDIKGKNLGILKEGRAIAGEKHTVIMDGSKLPNGLYFVKLESSDRSQVLKLLLQK